ncbi:hypothetical protein CR47_0207680 [Ralstonia solanacearum]|nr:D-amino acid dehydrogenase 1 [Ralstonia solanacearum]ATI29439.1 hypothetical protein CCY86_18210 [Ralstonia solanacearum]ATJ88201.1 hypothetical protein CDC59_18095 [Ralstonia solanacearum]KEI30397.1 hypothetical protein CQ06_06855 [Ralstonia solanacearum]KFX77987.1 hypothetical protein KR98_16250 [Ralstonia solanacearum]
MRVLVRGSGVIGTSIAYYIVSDSHEVTVVDRLAGPALETGCANAGEVSPGYSAPWVSTGQGTLGWTMAAGTGRVMADVISGRPPEIAIADLAVTRYA